MNGVRSQDPLGDLLRQLRNGLGWSLEQVEQKSLGRWKAVVIGSYERGDRQPTVARVRELLAFYGWKLEAVGPGDVVVRFAENTERLVEFVEWVVQYGPHLELTIVCPKGEEEARTIAAHMWDAKIAYRTHHIGPLYYVDGES